MRKVRLFIRSVRVREG